MAVDERVKVLTGLPPWVSQASSRFSAEERDPRVRWETWLDARRKNRLTLELSYQLTLMSSNQAVDFAYILSSKSELFSGAGECELMGDCTIFVEIVSVI